MVKIKIKYLIRMGNNTLWKVKYKLKPEILEQIKRGIINFCFVLFYRCVCPFLYVVSIVAYTLEKNVKLNFKINLETQISVSSLFITACLASTRKTLKSIASTAPWTIKTFLCQAMLSSFVWGERLSFTWKDPGLALGLTAEDALMHGTYRNAGYLWLNPSIQWG